MTENKTDTDSTYCWQHVRDKPCKVCAYVRAGELIYLEKAPRSSSTDFDELSPKVQEPYFRFAEKLLNTLREEGHLPSEQAPLEQTNTTMSEEKPLTAQEALLKLARSLMEQIEVTSDAMEGLGYLNTYALIRETVDKMNAEEEEQKGGKKS